MSLANIEYKCQGQFPLLWKSKSDPSTSWLLIVFLYRERKTHNLVWGLQRTGNWAWLSFLYKCLTMVYIISCCPPRRPWSWLMIDDYLFRSCLDLEMKPLNCPLGGKEDRTSPYNVVCPLSDVVSSDASHEDQNLIVYLLHIE